jgi:hypothetical protein
VRVQPVGERLQVGVAVDLEEIMRRERQRVQVRDHRAFRAGDDLAVADEVDARNHVGQSARFQRVDQLEEAVLRLALEDVIHILVVRRLERLQRHDRQVRPAQNGDQPALFAQLRHRPRIGHQRRGGGDADHVVGAALGFRLIQVIIDAHILDGRVEDHHLVAALTQDCGQIAQPQRDVLAHAPNFGFGAGKNHSHSMCLDKQGLGDYEITRLEIRDWRLEIAVL